MRDAVPPCGTAGGAEQVRDAGTAPPPEPSGSRVLTTRAGRTAPDDRTADPVAPDSPGTPGDDSGGSSRPAPRPSPLDNTSKVILGVSGWGVWGLWGGVCPNLLHGRSVAGSGASGAQGPDPILASWEDRSGPRPGCVRRFPHDCAVLTASQSGVMSQDMGDGSVSGHR